MTDKIIDFRLGEGEGGNSMNRKRVQKLAADLVFSPPAQAITIFSVVVKSTWCPPGFSAIV